MGPTQRRQDLVAVEHEQLVIVESDRHAALGAGLKKGEAVSALCAKNLGVTPVYAGFRPPASKGPAAWKFYGAGWGTRGKPGSADATTSKDRLRRREWRGDGTFPGMDESYLACSRR